MFTPNNPHEGLETNLPDWLEPFPEPQTIPTRWDISEILAVCASVSIEDADISPKG